MGTVKKQINEELFIKASSSLATLYNTVGKPQRSLEILDDAMKVIEHLNNEKERITCLLHISECYSIMNDVSKVEEYSLKGLEAAERLKDKEMLSYALNNMGFVCYFRKDYDKSLSYYGESLAIKEKLGIIGDSPTVYLNLGVVYEGLGDTEKERECYEKCLAISLKKKDLNIASITYNWLASWYMKAGETEKQFECLEEGLRLRKKLGYKKGEMITSNNIAVAYMRRCKYEKAKKYFEHALRIAQDINDPVFQSTILFNASKILYIEFDLEKAMNAIERSGQISEKIKDYTNLGYCHYLCGYIHLARGNVRKARKEYGELEVLLPKIGEKRLEIICSLMKAELALHSPVKEKGFPLEFAETALEKAGEYKDSELIANAVFLRATAETVVNKLDKNRIKALMSEFEKAIGILKQLGHPFEEALALGHYCRFLEVFIPKMASERKKELSRLLKGINASPWLSVLLRGN